MDQLNNPLWDACLTGDSKQISASIQEHHKHTDMCSLLDKFHDSNRERKKQLKHDPNSQVLDIPTESAIALALKEHKPFANNKSIHSMFLRLCNNLSSPDSMRTFIELYADKLTSGTIKDGLDEAYTNWRCLDKVPFQFSEVVDACIENVKSDAYWKCIIICCHDERPDLVKRLMSMDDCPVPLVIDSRVCLQYCSQYGDVDTARLILNMCGERDCESLLVSCANALNIEIPEAVFSEYDDILTPKVTMAGFKSACFNNDPEVIQMYIDRFEVLEDRQEIDTDSLRDCYSNALNTAVSNNRVGIVEVLLERCMHMLSFESGNVFEIFKYGSVANMRNGEEILKLLQASYSLRVIVNKFRYHDTIQLIKQ